MIIQELSVIESHMSPWSYQRSHLSNIF